MSTRCVPSRAARPRGPSFGVLARTRLPSFSQPDPRWLQPPPPPRHSSLPWPEFLAGHPGRSNLWRCCGKSRSFHLGEGQTPGAAPPPPHTPLPALRGRSLAPPWHHPAAGSLSQVTGAGRAAACQSRAETGAAGRGWSVGTARARWIPPLIDLASLLQPDVSSCRLTEQRVRQTSHLGRARFPGSDVSHRVPCSAGAACSGPFPPPRLWSTAPLAAPGRSFRLRPTAAPV